MKKMFEKIRKKIGLWMYGRYGVDELSVFLIGLCLVLSILSMIPSLGIISVISFAVLLWVLFRCFSKKRQSRLRELEFYLRIKKRFTKRCLLMKDMWRERKTHLYFKCPKCGAILRVPKNKGEIEVRCPRCGTKTNKKT